ncbi:hypothetical protein GWN42_13415 [candidate division KSB1 bacterium]|nr:hypothetical protein [candidate division KSB1 bacterium]
MKEYDPNQIKVTVIEQDSEYFNVGFSKARLTCTIRNSSPGYPFKIGSVLTVSEAIDPNDNGRYRIVYIAENPKDETTFITAEKVNS